MERKIKRGDMFYADLTHGVGSEQYGIRPVLIIQNDIGNKYSPTVIVAIITSRISKPKIPTHCPIMSDQGLGRDSIIMLEQIRTIDKARLRGYIGRLSSVVIKNVDNALSISVGLNIDNLHL